jgi:hypothetical protein
VDGVSRAAGEHPRLVLRRARVRRTTRNKSWNADEASAVARNSARRVLLRRPALRTHSPMPCCRPVLHTHAAGSGLLVYVRVCVFVRVLLFCRSFYCLYFLKYLSLFPSPLQVRVRRRIPSTFLLRAARPAASPRVAAGSRAPSHNRPQMPGRSAARSVRRARAPRSPRPASAQEDSSSPREQHTGARPGESRGPAPDGRVRNSPCQNGQRVRAGVTAQFARGPRARIASRDARQRGRPRWNARRPQAALRLADLLHFTAAATAHPAPHARARPHRPLTAARAAAFGRVFPCTRRGLYPQVHLGRYVACRRKL